jgi:hypothetical protein
MYTQGGLYTYRLRQLDGNLSQLITLIAVKGGEGRGIERVYIWINAITIMWEIKYCVCVCVFVHMHQNQYPHPNTEQRGLLMRVNFGSYNMLLIYQS